LSSEKPSLFPQDVTGLISVFWTLIISKERGIKLASYALKPVTPDIPDDGRLPLTLHDIKSG